MSEFHVEVVRVGKIEKHPNADSLSITKVFDYTVILRTGDFSEGDLAVYVPIDSVVPDEERWAFLGGHRRIKAKKLRGIFSQGLLTTLPGETPAQAGCADHAPWRIGDDVVDILNIVKYEPVEHVFMGGDCEAWPHDWLFPIYTDIEGMRRYTNVIAEGEPVGITEKLHGTNFRAVHDGERLWVGSHRQIKKRDDANLYWRGALGAELETKLAAFPKHVFYGELVGKGVQDLDYGHAPGSIGVLFFDVFSAADGRYLNFDDAFAMVAGLGLQWVPILHRGPWSKDNETLSEGASTLAEHVREGIVVRPLVERHEHMGRVILKRAGEGYMLRGEKKAK
jgi:RNA ligase (TIGR02306 family)